MSKIKLIAVVGRSASGKDTLVRGTLMRHPNLNPVVHYTTRPKRPGEIEGKDYYFLSLDEFKRMENNQDFFSIACFNNWYYAIGQGSFNPEKINIGIFSPIELKWLKDSDKFELYPIETWADEISRYHRSLERLGTFDSVGLQEICRRNEADEKDFKTIEHIQCYELDTTDDFAHYIGQGFMSGLLYGLGYSD